VIWAFNSPREESYMLFAILFIPARTGFQMQSLACETSVSVSNEKGRCLS
jgi:hypothetical protein